MRFNVPRYVCENGSTDSFGYFAKDPSVIEFNGKYYLYFSVMEKPKILGIGIAESSDGDDFQFVGILPRTQDCEIKGIGAPGAIVLNGAVHLFYQTYGNNKLDAICHATSSDGIHFEKDATNPVFAPREPWTTMPEWACGRAIDADIVLFNGKLFLYFATRDKEFKRQIVGAAYADASSDFSSGTFTCSHDIVLEPILPWEKDCIEAPAAMVHNGRVYMFYAGAYNCEPQQIGCAVSEDGLHFQRLFVEAPLLTAGNPGEWNACESGHPYIYPANDGRIWLYYQGSPDMGKTYILSRNEIVFENGIPRVL